MKQSNYLALGAVLFAIGLCMAVGNTLLCGVLCAACMVGAWWAFAKVDAIEQQQRKRTAAKYSQAA